MQKIKKTCIANAKIWKIWLANAQWITRGKKKDMVSTIYDNNQKEATRKIIYQNSSTMLEIKNLSIYLWSEGRE